MCRSSELVWAVVHFERGGLVAASRCLGSDRRHPGAVGHCRSETSWVPQSGRSCGDACVTKAAWPRPATPRCQHCARSPERGRTLRSTRHSSSRRGILSSTDGPLDREAVRAENGDNTRALRPLAPYKLGLITERTDFVYTLQNVAIFEDFGVWQRGLEGFANQEVQVECSACGDHVYLELTDNTSVASLDPDDLGAGTRLEPAAPSDLHAPESTLFELAGAHQQNLVQAQLLQLFEHFVCPACNTRVRIASALG